jgi:ribosomal-protein-alanine N-acetyltransferase
MEPVKLSIAPISEAQCEEICGWTYPPPYDAYNSAPWDRMVAEQSEWADPAIRQAQYSALIEQTGKLAGFAQFFPLVGVTRLGLGLRPDLCGQGLGVEAVRLIVREAQRRRPDDEIDLEVLTWNERAIRTYEKAGFRRTDAYDRMTPTGMAPFYCMVYEG